jgi:hypothetical protein
VSIHETAAKCLRAVLGFTALTVAAMSTSQTLPPPSRTVYKCVVEGRISYSDEPCLGARRVDVEPTRGLNKSTGTEQLGRDVQLERRREGIAEALRPITGMDAQEFAQFSRRQSLPSSAQRECQILDRAISDHEQMERVGRGVARESATRKLFFLRSRAKELGC